MYLGYNSTNDNVSLVSSAGNSNPDLWKVTFTGTNKREFTLTALNGGDQSEQAALLSYDHTSCSSGSVFLSRNMTDQRDVSWRWFGGRIIAAVSLFQKIAGIAAFSFCFKN